MIAHPNIDGPLAMYDAIGLAEMDGVSLMNRFDTKYTLGEADLIEALGDLTDRYRVLEIDGVRRCAYSTLYFDTPSRDCYREHHNGKANRRKYRMRSYASSGKAFFEIKTKTNRGRTVKKRVPIEAIREKLTPQSDALVRRIAGEPVALSPQLWVSFSRITLVARDAEERVTLDPDLEFRMGASVERLPGQVIAEVKQGRQSRDSAIREWLREHHVRPLRVSKYCVGSALLDPALKQNNFKSKLRTLQTPPSAETRSCQNSK